MDISSITATLTSGILGAVLGYLGKSLVDNYFATRRHKLEKEFDKEQYQAENFLIPLTYSLNRFLNRLKNSSGMWHAIYGNHGHGEDYMHSSMLYEFCCICFWLERINRDPKLSGSLPFDTENRLRKALTKLSDLPTYKQKSVGEDMVDSRTNSFGPISYPSFMEKKYSQLKSLYSASPIMKMTLFGAEINSIEEINSVTLMLDKKIDRII